MKTILTKMLLTSMLFSAVIQSVVFSAALEKPEKRNEMLTLITKTHQEVFSQEDLFAQENEKTDVWKKTVGILEFFINSNADGNKTLLEAYDLCKSTGNQTIDKLRVVHYSVVEKKISSTDDTAEKKYNRFESFLEDIKELTEKKINLKKMSNVLKNTTFYIRAPQKKDAKDVLLHLMSTLETIIEQLEKDFSARKSVAYDEYYDSIPSPHPGSRSSCCAPSCWD